MSSLVVCFVRCCCFWEVPVWASGNDDDLIRENTRHILSSSIYAEHKITSRRIPVVVKSPYKKISIVTLVMDSSPLPQVLSSIIDEYLDISSFTFAVDRDDTSEWDGINGKGLYEGFRNSPFIKLAGLSPEKWSVKNYDDAKETSIIAVKK